jgi:Ribbon-helix-helix domain
MDTVRWSLIISDETDKALRTYLAQKGMKKGDLSRFVEEAVQRQLFEQTVEDIKARNAHHDQQEILDTLDEAVAYARRC